jgi:ribonuclease E
MGRISQFGLMELSRQRLRASLQELSSQICPHCAGLGVVRSTESCALQTLRAIQEAGIRGDTAALTITAPAEVALYLLNQKRGALGRLEHAYAMRVTVQIGPDLVPPVTRLDMTEKRDRERERERVEAIRADHVEGHAEEIAEEPAREDAERLRLEGAARGGQPRHPTAEEGEEAGARRRRKRRRRRRRPSEAGAPPEMEAAPERQGTIDSLVQLELEEDAEPAGAEVVEAVESVDQTVEIAVPGRDEAVAVATLAMPVDSTAEPVAAGAEVEEKPAGPARPRRPRKPRAPEPVVDTEQVEAALAIAAPVPNGADEARVFATEVAGPEEAEPAGREPSPSEEELATAEAEDRPQRQGWWSRWVR